MLLTSGELHMAFIGPWEIGLILIVVFILFGPKRLPELAKGIGNAIREYRKASEGLDSPLSEIKEIDGNDHSDSKKVKDLGGISERKKGI